MSDLYKKFVNSAEKTAFDSDAKEALRNNINLYKEARDESKNQFNNLELAKRKIAKIRKNVLFDLENYLKEFETKFTKNGGNLVWAPDKSFALDAISKILKSNNAKNIIQSKSILSEEIGLRKNLESDNFNIINTETDISKTQQEINEFIIKKVKPAYLNADVGIITANFLLADIGGISFSENEGNVILSANMPKVNIVIAGIEDVLPSIKDLDIIWPILSTNKNGEKTSAINSVITAPQNSDEKLYVILIDNGRTNVLKTKYQYEALSCIKCGACINECPITQEIGEQTFNSAYTGPIGSILIPLMEGFENYNHLAYACTDCEKCNDVCPVNIPLSHLILRNRKYAISEGFEFDNLKKSIKLYKKLNSKSSLVEKLPKFVNQSIMSSGLKAYFGKRKVIPKLADKSFSDIWKEERGV